MSTKLRMLKCSFIWKLERSDGLFLIPGLMSSSDDWQYLSNRLWGSGQHCSRLIEWLYQDFFSLKQSTFMSFSLLLNEICILHLSLKKCWGFKVLQKLNSISTPDGGGQGAGKLNIVAGGWQTLVKRCHQSIALGAKLWSWSSLKTSNKMQVDPQLWIMNDRLFNSNCWRLERERLRTPTSNCKYLVWTTQKTFRAEFLCKKSKEGS